MMVVVNEVTEETLSIQRDKNQKAAYIVSVMS